MLRCCFVPLALVLGALAPVTAVIAQPVPAADDARPVVDDSKTPATQPAKNDLPSLFLVGDSTMNSNPAPMRGWAQELGTFFDGSKINVVNRAIGGRSSRTFQNEGRWDKLLAELKPGDFVFVQFGHNDVGRYDDPAAKGRPSLHGDGDETAEVTKADGSKETVRSFGWYMRKYATDAQARGATVVLCSMVPHKDWKDGKISRGERDRWVKWTREAAATTGAKFIDLNEIIAHRYEQLGPDAVEQLFADRRTHTSVEGAKLNAEAVIAGLKALDGLEPLKRSLAPGASAVAPATQPVAASR